ncbi:hypothetical protein LDO26_00670 [Luteimonas sp. BDR2-5]|uniref:hypothetical protein n=1 Tax=Proluteimonas luteida TaxID=2878685 RepID=UPI001E503F52|nr:hypothetical protein [Luteimonas sp. BDR2-5]MCD9026727.1 hypothetical protein [Luteimonas sp. BDR2-5]
MQFVLYACGSGVYYVYRKGVTPYTAIERYGCALAISEAARGVGTTAHWRAALASIERRSYARIDLHQAQEMFDLATGA